MKALIDKAIEKLNTIKSLKLSLNDFRSSSDNVDLQLFDESTQWPIFVSFKMSDICDARHLDEPQHLSILDIRILRIARVIYDEYKKALSHITNSNIQTISASDLVSTTCDLNINGRSLTTTFDEVDDLKNKLNNLQTEKDHLEQELQSTKAIVDLLLQRCQDKGIL